MDRTLTREKLLEFLRRLGGAARTPGRCYVTGGTSAVLVGWRGTTVDVDLCFDPEPAGVFEVIPRLKEELAVNVELAAPKDFIPVPAAWAADSPHVGTFGLLEVFHFDFTSQALAKLARGHARDLADVRAMLERRLVTVAKVRRALTEVQPHLVRYPALEAGTFVARITRSLAGLEGGRG